MHSPDKTPTQRKPSRRRTWQLRAMMITAALGFSTLAAEDLLQVAPGLLPASCRDHYPQHDLEFFNPGILDRTPLTAVPLPYDVEPYDGSPPRQNADFGVASMKDTLADRQAHRSFTVQCGPPEPHPLVKSLPLLTAAPEKPARAPNHAPIQPPTPSGGGRAPASCKVTPHA